MEYTEKEMKTIEQAKSNLLRGNDIESATLILEKVILDGMIIKCGRINILKVAARQIINFIEEYKNKEYLDVVREKVYANEESRRKDELIKKQQKEIEYKNKYIEDIENQHELELIGKEEYTKAVMSEIIEDYYVPIEEYEKIREELYNSIPKDTIKEKMEKILIIVKKYNKQMKNGKETDISYDELRKYVCELEVYRKLLEED